MTHYAVWAAAFLAVAGTSVAAQGVTGGKLGIEYNAPTDGSDFGGTTYSGGLEYGINRDFSVGINGASYRPDNIDTKFSTVTLHGIYHLSDTASAGVFLGRDMTSGGNATVYGVEGGTELVGADVGGYAGIAAGDGDNAVMVGADGSYGIANGFNLIGSFDLVNVDDVTTNQLSVGVRYDIPSGPGFYAKIGNASARVDGTSENQGFFSVGVDVAIGNMRGTTFDQRSSFEALPGF